MSERLAAAAVRKARESAATKEAFFVECATSIASCAEAMSAAFDAGGKLLSIGNGGSSCDAAHVAVEFMHPVIEKRRAIPAMSLSGDAALLSAIGNDHDFSLAFAHQVKLLARPGDVVLGLSTSGKSANVVRALRAAREQGALTVGLTGRDGGKFPEVCDHVFVVPSFSIHRIQEVHETLIHVLWDLVHLVRGEEDVL